jgi:DUF1680 family protein
MQTETTSARYAVDLSRSAAALLKPVPVSAVSLTGDFWGPRLRRNVDVTLPSQYDLLESTGRLDNFRRVVGQSDAPFVGVFFNDSDVYKWIEAASWAQVDGAIPALQRRIDEAIDLIAAAQGEDGYINTYFSLERQGERWTDLRDLHEMYCGGHLIQAAVAHHRVTGQTRLLDVATRFADLLCQLFGPVEQGKRVAVDGHEEIEMALIELARETGNARYLEQARFFIEARGHGLLHGGRWGLEYFQDHVPFRAMDTLCGHAVRALYMACGVTDLALESGDRELLERLEAQWANLTTRRMYITGGVGSRHDGESIGKDLELPNARAYTETCAAVGSMMWNHRLLAATGRARYADLLEWTLYNGMLPGWALDGKHYFYVNPLEDDGTHHRQPWYEVSCCPPNIARTLAELPGYVYSTRGDEIHVNLFIEGEAAIPLGGRTIHLTQRTLYPWDGAVQISVATGGQFTLQVRVPGWCDVGASISINGDGLDQPIVSGEYLAIKRLWQAGDIVQLTLPMAVRQWRSHPHLHENAGRVAISRGPVLYCVESLDHQGLGIDDLALDGATQFDAVFEPDTLGGVVVLRSHGHCHHRDEQWDASLYLPIGGEAPAQLSPAAVTAIPYFVWQNRGAAQMAVWLNRENACC